MEVSGIVKKIFDIQKFPSGFKKRELVIYTNEQYPQYLSIEFIQDKIDILNNIKIDDEIKVFINLKGREWVNSDGVTKYFNTIQGWRIEKINSQIINSDSDFSDNNSDDNIISESSSDEISSDDNFDDLPF